MNDGAHGSNMSDDGAHADPALRDIEVAVRNASDAALRQLQDDGFTTALLQQRLPSEARRRVWWRRLVLGSAAGSGTVAAVVALTFEWPRLTGLLTQAAAMKAAAVNDAQGLPSLDTAAHPFSVQSALHWAMAQPAAEVAAVAIGLALLLTAAGWMTRAFEP